MYIKPSQLVAITYVDLFLPLNRQHPAIMGVQYDTEYISDAKNDCTSNLPKYWRILHAVEVSNGAAIVMEQVPIFVMEQVPIFVDSLKGTRPN